MFPDSRSSDSNVLGNEFNVFVECSCVSLLSESASFETAVTHTTPPVYRSRTHDGRPSQLVPAKHMSSPIYTTLGLKELGEHEYRVET